jgi:N-acetylglucosaminyl-diphospho-decaprenol L-rhamnosyltransferase
MARPNRFSAIVVSYFTGPIVFECMSALLRDDLCGELLLVNNGNTPDTLLALQDLASQNGKLNIIHGQGNVGFGAGCNLGAAQAEFDRLLFVNPDCLVDDGTLAAFGDALSCDPLALLGGALRNQDGSEQRGCRRGELTLWSAVISFSGLGRPGVEAGIWRDFNRNREPFPVEVQPMPIVSGALMAVSVETFERVGGFDAGYFLHVEDIDLCARIGALPRKVVFVPRATALHVGATSRASSWTIERAKIAGFARYFFKHAHGLSGRLAAGFLMPCLALVIVVRMLLKPKK